MLKDKLTKSPENQQHYSPLDFHPSQNTPKPPKRLSEAAGDVLKWIFDPSEKQKPSHDIVFRVIKWFCIIFILVSIGLFIVFLVILALMTVSEETTPQEAIAHLQPPLASVSAPVKDEDELTPLEKQNAEQKRLAAQKRQQYKEDQLRIMKAHGLTDKDNLQFFPTVDNFIWDIESDEDAPEKTQHILDVLKEKYEKALEYRLNFVLRRCMSKTYTSPLPHYITISLNISVNKNGRLSLDNLFEGEPYLGDAYISNLNTCMSRAVTKISANMPKDWYPTALVTFNILSVP